MFSVVSVLGPQAPKWRTSGRAEHSSMSSLVSAVIRQDREDKAVMAVHLPKASGEGRAKASHHVQDRAAHIGNGKNGMSFDTGVHQPDSPSHQVSRLYRWGREGGKRRG